MGGRNEEVDRGQAEMWTRHQTAEWQNTLNWLTGMASRL